jgi:transposase
MRITTLALSVSFGNLQPLASQIYNCWIPNIKENPRNRKHTKRGRKRLFNAAIHALRMRVERTFAWEDKFKRLLLRFERIQQRHYGMKLLGYTMINLREFCGI